MTVICDSAYFEQVSNVKVPTMTSNTTPSGECSASTCYSDELSAWKAFNGDKTISDSNRWVSGGGTTTNQWLQYKFAKTTKVIKIAYISYNTRQPKNCKVQASNDGNTFIDLISFTSENVYDKELTVSFTNNKHYLFYRLFFEDMWIPSSRVIGIHYLQFYGRQ